ncbi:MAG TPA: phosphoribosylamine--glycine ligase [Actinomycetota bacterium]|nr:phosphoribosylamine--glycine ligase [Actinomycetota bacterium]
MSATKVLLLGSGGRESALAWALARSASTSELVAAPGNAGIAEFAAIEPAPVLDAAGAVAVATRVQPDLVVIGPEAPLVAGAGGALRERGFAVFGPDASAARVEGSKTHAKELMERAGIPATRWGSFTSPDDAIAFADELGPPYVIKADGLAAGKGVVVTPERDEAIAAIRAALLEGRFGEAGQRVVVEEFLDGEELSLIAFSDGANLLACEPAQDFKRALDGDQGPNTGGMGSYSPVPSCPPSEAERIADDLLRPMLQTIAEEGAPFVGALYAGLALTSKGPRVVEFNARFGDPETQALVPRLRSDLAAICLACAKGDLSGTQLEWTPDRCVTVVLAAGGYPGPHSSGLPIEGLDDAASLPGVYLFHAGTAVENGRLVTAGGRVMAVSALGPSLKAARSVAYHAVSKISFPHMHFRTDIAARAASIEGSTT